MKKETYVAPVMEIVLLERGGAVVTSGCEDGDCCYNAHNFCACDGGVCRFDGICLYDCSKDCSKDCSNDCIAYRPSCFTDTCTGLEVCPFDGD